MYVANLYSCNLALTCSCCQDHQPLSMTPLQDLHSPITTGAPDVDIDMGDAWDPVENAKDGGDWVDDDEDGVPGVYLQLAEGIKDCHCHFIPRYMCLLRVLSSVQHISCVNHL